MTVWTVISTGFLLGLGGSLHCVGMCGPLVLSLPSEQNHPWMKPLLYHASRSWLYGLMGVMVAWMGDRVQGLFGHGIQHILSVTTGLLMLLIYLLKPRWKLFSSSHSFLKGWSALSRQGDLMGHAAMGALNAFLPCGLVYVALAMALSTSVPWQGGLLMLSFGIGTSPLLCGIQLFKGRGLLRLKAMQWVKPTMVVSCSFVLILRGLGLGIPFLSPSINIESEETPSCCAAQQ